MSPVLLAVILWACWIHVNQLHIQIHLRHNDWLSGFCNVDIWWIYICVYNVYIRIYIVNMWWIHGGYTMFLSVSIMQNWMWVNDRDICGAEGMKYLKASNCFVADRSTILCKKIDNSWRLKQMTSGRYRKGVLISNKCMELQCTCLQG